MLSALSVLLPLGLAGAGEPEPPGPTSVLRIQVKGSLTKAPETVLAELLTRPGETCTPDELADRMDADLRRLWDTGLYATPPEWSARREGGGLALTLALVERPWLSAVEFRGNSRKFGRDDLLGIVRREGLAFGGRARYDEGLAYRASRALRRHYLGKGHLTVEIGHHVEDYEGPDALSIPGVKLVYTIREGRRALVRGFRLVGNRVFSDRELGKLLRDVLAGSRAEGEEQAAFDRLAFEQALRFIQYRLYCENGYLDAELKLDHLMLYAGRRGAVAEVSPEGELPEGRAREAAVRDAWLVPHIEICEGERYAVGSVSVKLDYDPKADPSGDKLALTAEDLMRVVTDPGEEFTELGMKPFREGSVFSRQAIQSVEARLKDSLGRFGRIMTEVRSSTDLPREGTRIDVAFQVKPSRVYTIRDWRVRGNAKTRDFVFERELEQAGLARPEYERDGKGDWREVRPGSIADSRKIELARRKIRYTRLVADKRDEAEGTVRQAVAVTPYPHDDGTATLAVDVNEGDTGQLMVGATVNSNGELSGMLQFTHGNFDISGLPRAWNDWTNAFVGAGQTFTLNAMFGEVVRRNVEAQFTEPYAFGWPVEFKLGYYDFQAARTGYVEERRGYSARLGKAWQVHPFKMRRLGLWLTWKDEGVDLIPGSGAPPQILADEGAWRLHRGMVSLTYDSRDDRIVPSKGSFFQASRDVVGGPLGGDRSFTKEAVEYNVFKRLGQNESGQPHVLQIRIEAARADPFSGDLSVPVFERFYAGGFGPSTTTLRGYRYRSVGPYVVEGTTTYPIGGSFSAGATIEYTFPMAPDETIRGSIFYDAANVWAGQDDFDAGAFKQTVGIGILLRPPGTVPISLHFCNAIDPAPEDRTERISFNIGTMWMY
jgi:outer membrane protein insertion porin family